MDKWSSMIYWYDCDRCLLAKRLLNDMYEIYATRKVDFNTCQRRNNLSNTIFYRPVTPRMTIWLVEGIKLATWSFQYFSCDQTALWMVFSARPSVRLSVCYTFSLCSHHRIIMTFSGVITSDKSDVHTKGQRSKVKVTEVTTQLNRFRTVTPVWIHQWLWNDAQSLK